MTPRQRYHAEIEAIARLHGVTFEDVVGPRRVRPIVAARNAAMWAIWFAHGLSLPRVGRLFGRKHPAVIYAIGSHLSRIDPTHKLAAATRRKHRSNVAWRRANPTRQGRRA